MNTVSETPEKLNSQLSPSLLVALNELEFAALAFHKNAHLSRPTIEDSHRLETAFYRVFAAILRLSSSPTLRSAAITALRDGLRLATLEPLTDKHTLEETPLFRGCHE